MLALIERFKGYLVAIGAAVALALVAYLRGLNAGKGAEQDRRSAELNEKAALARKEVRDVQLETNRMDDDAVAAELERDWVRNPDTRRR